MTVTDVTETAEFRQQSVAMNESLLQSVTRQHELTEMAESLSSRLQASVRARDHFLAVLSHELRNPLAALSSGLQLLKMAAQDREVATDSREMMERQLNHLVRLVDDLLDISRISTGKLVLQKERVELESVVNDVVEASRAFVAKNGHQLVVELPRGPVVLNADPARLTQVFLNLVSNAAKYSAKCRAIRLTARVKGVEVEVSVQDQGIGIDLPPVSWPKRSASFFSNLHFEGVPRAMGRKRYTEEQIAFAIRQHESGTAIAEIIRKMGISEQTFYRWKKPL